MRVLIDTNVLIDYLAERHPFFEDALRIIKACESEEIEGSISTQSISDIFYILRKEMTESERRRILLSFCRLLTVDGVQRHQIIEALENGHFPDFEDCIQSTCARAFHADYIVTRNEKDFEFSEVSAISPKVFCARFLHR